MAPANPNESPSATTCPICKMTFVAAASPAFPFCSIKCRLLDLGKWLDGKYSTSRPLDPSDDDELESPSNPDGR